MKIKIGFPAGAYSKNKEEIKKVFNILDYKYQNGFQDNNKLVCIWKRKNDKKTIRAVFSGSGQPCYFIVDCDDNEFEVFKSFNAYNAIVSTDLESSIDTQRLLQEAKAKVDKWFTWQKPYKGEPELFYNKRIEKMNQTYEWFVNRELQRMKENAGA